jgi:hypothetical protein
MPLIDATPHRMMVAHEVDVAVMEMMAYRSNRLGFPPSLGRLGPYLEATPELGGSGFFFSATPRFRLDGRWRYLFGATIDKQVFVEEAALARGQRTAAA